MKALCSGTALTTASRTCVTQNLLPNIQHTPNGIKWHKKKRRWKKKCAKVILINKIELKIYVYTHFGLITFELTRRENEQATVYPKNFVSMVCFSLSLSISLRVYVCTMLFMWITMRINAYENHENELKTITHTNGSH